MPHNEAHSDSHNFVFGQPGTPPEAVTYKVDVGKGSVRLPIGDTFDPVQAREIALFRVRQWFDTLDPKQIKNARVEGPLDYKDSKIPFITVSTFDAYKDAIIRRSGLTTDSDNQESDPEELNGSEFPADPIAFDTSNLTDPAQGLDDMLAGVDDREQFFNRNVVDPRLAFGGSSRLRGLLQRGFDPFNAAFQANQILSDEGDPILAQGAFENSLGAAGSGVPTTSDIRTLLTEINRRQKLGGEVGGLSGVGAELIQNEQNLGRLMNAASGARDITANARGAFANAFARRLQNARFADPYSENLLSNFVSSGFRLPNA
jgi:hypothetical protein